MDRPAVSFYEIDGFRQNPDAPDPFNVHNAPTWRPLLELARERSDVLVNGGVGFTLLSPDPLAELRTVETWTDAAGSRFTRTVIRAPGRNLSQLTRRDPAIDTVWTLEHFLKDEADLQAWLALPAAEPRYRLEAASYLELESRVGEAGLVMLGCGDPVCCVAPLFDMGTWTVLALTEPELIRQALDRVFAHLLAQVELAARELPGRLWRICGPEYASEPYLPPRLFHEYVTGYDTELVRRIQRYGGFARVHSHGRLRNILDEIAATGCTGLDPIEPPHQGDVELAEVRQRYGTQLTLFGNLEITDLENLPPAQFAAKIATALREGPGGRGFVLMPSACPYGRTITPTCLRNYEVMLEMAAAG